MSKYEILYRAVRSENPGGQRGWHKVPPPLIDVCQNLRGHGWSDSPAIHYISNLFLPLFPLRTWKHPSLDCLYLLYKLSMQNLITPWLSYTHSQNYIPKCTSLSLLCIYIADSKWHLHGRERKCSTISLGGVVEAKEVAYQKLRFDWSLLLYLPLLYLKLRNVHAPLTFTSFVEGRIKFISKLEFIYSSYILRRPKNFAKSSPYFDWH